MRAFAESRAAGAVGERQQSGREGRSRRLGTIAWQHPTVCIMSLPSLFQWPSTTPRLGEPVHNVVRLIWKNWVHVSMFSAWPRSCITNLHTHGDRWQGVMLYRDIMCIEICRDGRHAQLAAFEQRCATRPVTPCRVWGDINGLSSGAAVMLL